MEPCPPADALVRFLEDRLDAVECRRIEAHVNDCDACQEELARVGRFDVPSPRPRHTPPPDLVERLRALNPFRTGAGEYRCSPVPPPDEPRPVRIGPYSVVAELGRGAMGTVYKARDEQLRSFVALKWLRPEWAQQEEARARLFREAQAARAISHDNVVTVHAVGLDTESGRPYLVMQMIEGETLAARLDRDGPLPPREAAALVRQVADGLAACHARGLVHRDLKPSNIMYDRAAGRARITDFGLAAPLDTEEGARLTRTGQLVGTPPYMAPEYIRAPQDGDARCDVYSLGVVLYELLTGTLPFRGQTLMVLRQVLEDEPVPPRRLDDRIPRDLETVCLKAMTKEPAHRYASATELADDLRRFEAGEPVRARPVRALGRALRWCRRRPLPATLALALATALTAGAATATALWLRAEGHRRDAEANEQRARAGEARAVAHLERARVTIDDCFDAVNSHPLLRGERMQPVRRLLYGKALKHYQELAATAPRDEPAGRFEAARAAVRLGDISADVGDLGEAITAYRKAQHLLEGLREEAPHEERYAREEAVCANNLAIALDRSGKAAEAAEAFGRACEARAALAARHPNDPGLQRQRAETLMNQAVALRGAGRAAEALAVFAQARDLQERLCRDQPREPEVLHELARTCNNMGVAEGDLARPAEALALHERARGLCQEALALTSSAAIRSDLAWSEDLIGGVHRSQGRRAEAIQAWRRARPLYEEAAQAEPSLAAQARLAGCCRRLGVALAEGGELAEAERFLRQAEEAHAALAAAGQRDVAAQRDHAETLLHLAHVCANSGRREEAGRLYHQAVTQREKAVELSGDSAACRLELATSLFSLAVFRQASPGGAEAARAAYHRAEALLRRLYQDHPERLEFGRQLARTHLQMGHFFLEQDQEAEAVRQLHAGREVLEPIAREPGAVEARRDLAKCYSLLGRAIGGMGQRSEAADWMRRALALQREFFSQDPNYLYNRVALAETLNNLGAVSDLGDAGRLVLLREAIEHQRYAVAKAPHAPWHRQNLSAMYGNLATTQRKQGRVAEAVATALERRALWPKDGEQLFEVACDLAESAGLLSAGEPERRRAVEAAVETLRQARGAGFADMARLGREPRLKPLHGEPAFQALRAR